jgi:hypothetical protein
VKEKKAYENSSTGKGTSKKANLFLNSIIVFLGVIILFLLYSLVTKLQSDDEDLPETKPDKPSAIIQLEVLNGCGMPGVAEKFTDFLRRKNFDVVQTSNYRSFDIDNTMVIDRTGNKANAQKVADALGIENKFVIQQLNSDYFLDVSIVIGKDFNQLNPNK